VNSIKHAHWSGAAKEVLEKMMAKKDAKIFLEPVNTDEYSDYLSVVQHPMDFGTIESNLENNWYKSLEEFIADVKLVFTNCFTFNIEGD